MTEMSDKEIEEALADMISSSDSLPSHVISGSGWGWFLDPEAYQFIRCVRGTEIVLIDEIPDHDDRLLVRAPFRFLLIPENEVQEIGWN